MRCTRRYQWAGPGILTAALALAPAVPALPPEERGATENPAPQDPGVWDQVVALYEKAKLAGENVPDDVTEWVKQDLRSIGDWEYRVVRVPVASAAAAEAELNALGGERWECFWVQIDGDQTLFFMKRPMRSFIKTIPVPDLIKLLSSSDAKE